MLTRDAVVGARVVWDGRAATIMSEPTVGVAHRPGGYPEVRVCIRFDDNRAERYVSVASLLREPRVPTEEDVQRLREEWQFACRNGHSEAVRNARYKAYMDAGHAVAGGGS
jgi:hypothetical protein